MNRVLSRRDWLTGTTGGLAATLLPLPGRAAPDEPDFAPRDVEKRIDFHTTEVPNGEPPTGPLVADWRTPVERFYVRSHAPSPKVDLGSFRVKVEGLVERPLSFSIADLLGLPQHSVTATLTCAGNRRTEHSAVEKVGGVPWRAGAIGNAEWGGVPLEVLLKRAGVRDGARHVWFEGVDEIEKGGRTIGFGASIPLAKALATHGTGDGAMPGALVTLRMNGEPLALDHGFPVRTVVPGYIGARSVKWLGRIVVSDQPSPNHYVANAYKLVQRDDPLAWVEAGPIYKYAVNSVIASIEPHDGPRPAAASLWNVRGYALPPGDGRTIKAVELSLDGRQWVPARIESESRPYCWVLWSARAKVPAGAKSLTVRAIDSDGRVQPRTVPWNRKGYLFNAWHARAIPGTES